MSIMWIDDRAKFNSVTGARSPVVAPVEYRAVHTTNGTCGPTIIDESNTLRRGWRPSGFTETRVIDKVMYGIIDVGGCIFTIGSFGGGLCLVSTSEDAMHTVPNINHISSIYTAPTSDCTYAYAWSTMRDDTRVKLRTPLECDPQLHLFNADILPGKHPDGTTFVNSAIWTSWYARARVHCSGTITVIDPRDNSISVVKSDKFSYRTAAFGSLDTYLLAHDDVGSFHAFDTRNLAWFELFNTGHPIRCAYVY